MCVWGEGQAQEPGQEEKRSEGERGQAWEEQEGTWDNLLRREQSQGAGRRGRGPTVDTGKVFAGR